MFFGNLPCGAHLLSQDPVVLALRIVAPLKNLVAFRFCLDCTRIRYVSYGAKSAKVPPLEPAEEALVGWDVDDFARRLQQELGASANLQSIIVSLQGHRTRSSETVTVGATLSFDGDPSNDEDGSGHRNET